MNKDQEAKAETHVWALAEPPVSLQRPNPFRDMKDFMRVCGDELPSLSHHSGELSPQVHRYVRLCGEELDELQAATTLRTNDLGQVIAKLDAIADAATDLIYVAIGVMHSLGIPAEEVWRAVHSSNMTKVDHNGKVQRRLDGKILKPEHYRAPEITRVLTQALANANNSDR